MLLDKLALFEDKLALSTLLVATTLSTSSYDTIAAAANWPVNLTLGGAGGGPVGPGGLVGNPLLHDIGRGRPILLLAQIGVATTSGGAATLEEDVIAADVGALTTNAYVIQPGIVTPLATLVAGYRFPLKVVPGKVKRQFIGTQHIVGTAVFTAGTLTVGLALGTDDHADILGGQP